MQQQQQQQQDHHHAPSSSSSSFTFTFGGWKGLPSHNLAKRAKLQREPVEKEEELEGVDSERLQEEGCRLAERGCFREALARWEHALALTPHRAVLHELKAQVLMEEEKWWEAVQAATRATVLEPRWAEGFLTLGRAQLNYGELELAVASFEAAVELGGGGGGGSDDGLAAAGELARAQSLLAQQREIARAAAPLDLEELRERKRRALIGERQAHAGGGMACYEAEREAEGQDPRALWEALRQVSEDSLTKRRAQRERTEQQTAPFEVEEEEEEEEAQNRES